jgi:hypothetical protein
MNLLPLPKEFDQNEWFIIIHFIVLVLILIYLPKRFPTSITILILAFSIAIARVVDHLLAGPDINFYDVMDSGKYELFDLFCYVPYAPFAYIFIYIYDKWELNGIKLSVFITITSLFGILFEWITTASFINFFHYHSWKISYSLPVYLIIQPITLLFFTYIKKLHYVSLQKKGI